jgi:small acid-soluble spore protein H (minor)
MKLYRVQEILQSGSNIEVELSGIPVWIDSVDADKETAKVHVKEQPADSRVVPVEQLHEIE